MRIKRTCGAKSVSFGVTGGYNTNCQVKKTLTNTKTTPTGRRRYTMTHVKYDKPMTRAHDDRKPIAEKDMTAADATVLLLLLPEAF